MFALQPVFPRTGFYAADGYAGMAFTLGSILKPLLLLLATLWAWDATRLFDRDNPIRPAWQRLSLGLSLLLGGQLILAFYQLVLHVPIAFPSPADLLFVVAYPLLILALVAFLRAYEEAGLPTGRPGERRAIGALTAAVGLVAAVQLLRPVIAAEGPALEKALNLVYPTLDFVLLVPTAILLVSACASAAPAPHLAVPHPGLLLPRPGRRVLRLPRDLRPHDPRPPGRLHVRPVLWLPGGRGPAAARGASGLNQRCREGTHAVVRPPMVAWVIFSPAAVRAAAFLPQR
jgi:hypothetical protein